MTKRIGKVQQTDPPIILADHIRDISKAAKKLSDSGLNRKAVVVLLKHETGIGMGAIETVLNGLKQLEARYCEKGKK